MKRRAAKIVFAVMKAFSSVPLSDMRVDNERDIVGYVAAGHLGQYLIVLPEKKIVVSMISAASYRKISNNTEFSQIRKLAKQL